MTIVSALLESNKAKCYAPSFVAVNLCLALIDGALAFIAFLQKTVYVRGGKKEEEEIEVEVYNQGMTKTELCNKWQETHGHAHTVTIAMKFSLDLMR